MSRQQDPERLVRLSSAIAGSVDALLTAARDEVRQAEDPDQITETLAALRVLETEAEGRRLALLMARAPDPTPDDGILDSKQTAAFLGVSTDWIYRHRSRLVSAMVSPPGSNKKYSRVRLRELRDAWHAPRWRK